MNSMKQSNPAKFSLVCGIMMLICGLVIIGIVLYDGGMTPAYRLISGIVFAVAGALYIVVATRRLKQ